MKRGSVATARPRLFLSVDLDSWVHCRWASGGPDSIWPDSLTGYREVYGQDRPGQDFVDNCQWVLAAFRRQDISATFFILGEIAALFPELVRQVRDAGHEVALHGMHHVDNSRYSRDEFRAMIRKSRGILQDILQQEVVGYRAANLILDSEQLVVLDDEGFLYDSSVCPTRRLLGKYGMSFDLQVWSWQLEEAAKLGREIPEIPIILNHTGMPKDLAPEITQVWRAGMKALSIIDNVSVKISALSMMDWDWTTEKIRPFVMDTIEIMGAERCMFASNFPVDSLMTTYKRLWDAYDEITAEFSQSERDGLFWRNAERFYRI